MANRPEEDLAGERGQRPDQPADRPLDELRLANEFAAVSVSVDHRGNGPRLHIVDLDTGFGVLLDPLLLRGVALADEDELTALVVATIADLGS